MPEGYQDRLERAVPHQPQRLVAQWLVVARRERSARAATLFAKTSMAWLLRRNLKLRARGRTTDTLRLRGGYRQPVGEQLKLSDYDGLGWRAWADGLRETEERREKSQRRDER